jgi:hypothetical protein
MARVTLGDLPAWIQRADGTRIPKPMVQRRLGTGPLCRQCEVELTATDIEAGFCTQCGVIITSSRKEGRPYAVPHNPLKRHRR